MQVGTLGFRYQEYFGRDMEQAEVTYTQDAAAAALFAACKVEDTLKKSKEILCAAMNLTATGQDRFNPDDEVCIQIRSVIWLSIAD